MPGYTLTEYKIRKYVYLGHEDSLYIPASIRTSYYQQEQCDEVTGVRIIGRIVKQNETEKINSIVPIILKIKKEDKLHNDRLLIFALAVCAKFKLNHCLQMVHDAYEAVPKICTDGLKLLMFVKFCMNVNIILHDEGYLPTVNRGFGSGFSRAMKAWYLDRDPLLTTEQIVRHKHYGGWTHRDIIGQCFIGSADPTRQIFIVHTVDGMERVEELFGSKVKNIRITKVNESFENKQLKFIYNFLKQAYNLQHMNEDKLRNEIEFRRWGKTYEIIPEQMLKSPKILTAVIMHLPLRTVLENTFNFAKNGLFCYSPHDVGLWGFISRFNKTSELKQSRIHPIESFIEYARYSRTNHFLSTMCNNMLKKQENSAVGKPENQAFFEIGHFEIGSFNSLTTNETSSTSLVKVATESAVERQPEVKPDVNHKKYEIIMKPTPKLAEKMLKFLSEDLLNKTLQILKPSECRILIAYDIRKCIKQKICYCSRLLYVHEAITLITLCLIYPDELPSKPTILGLKSPGKGWLKEIEVNYSKLLTFSYLESILFKTPVRNNLDSKKEKDAFINPLSTMTWARQKNKKYDVFVFMGTNKMNLRNIKNAHKTYQAFMNKAVKVIICCLNGKHENQTKCSRFGNILFIVGFDRNVGKLIDSFINDEF